MPPEVYDGIEGAGHYEKKIPIQYTVFDDLFSLKIPDGMAVTMELPQYIPHQTISSYVYTNSFIFALQLPSSPNHISHSISLIS